jgi:predicted RNA-binding protein with PUA-like domain
MKYWLIKSEPSLYSIDHMMKDKEAAWEGVRNYQARNFMMNEMKVGDKILFYHSNADPTCVAGIVEVSKPASPDRTAFDKKSDFFDPKSKLEAPSWFCVSVRFIRKFEKPVTLEMIKKEKRLAKMKLVQKGSRLSVQPVTAAEFEVIVNMAKN